MGSALEAVLRFKENEQAQQKAQADSILQATQLFQTARQQALANQMAVKQFKAGLAEKGLRETAAGGFERDESLTDPLTNILNASKVAEAAKTLNLPGVFQQVQQSVGGTPQGEATESADVMNQKDVYGEFTPQAKAAQKANEQVQTEIIKGPAEGAIGKIALANESLKNIDDIKKALFPDGTPKSFNREIAFGANPPAIRLPIIGRVGANVRRDNPIDPTDNPVVEKTQDVFRKIGASLSGRQLIQTGVAARPEETQKLLEQFGPNFFSNPEAALKGLNELQEFYKDYLKNALPEKRLGKDKVANKTLDVDTAKKILAEAGGDKKKAREIAKQQGYSF
jgi:hypothetical protein